MNKVSIVIPAFNEESAVQSVVAELHETLLQHGISSEIIVVDDGSNDETAKNAAAAGARVVRHRSNRGYGAALKTGIACATTDYIVITDADGTYPARHIPALLAELKRADMVVGARVGQGVKIPLIRRPAKMALNILANYLTRAKIPDLNSGLRAFRRDMVMQYFPILPDQFSWTTTITLAMLCDKYAVSYLPIEYRQRKGKSKILPWDAGSFFILILRTIMLFRPLRVFFPIVVICLAAGFTKMGIDLSHQPNISSSAQLALMSALLILLIGMLGDAIATRMGRYHPNAIVGVQTDELSLVENEVLGEDQRSQQKTAGLDNPA